jgi:phage terminase small subunit
LRERKTDITELLKLEAQGWSRKRLAEYFKCSRANICKLLKKHKPVEVPDSFKQLTAKEQAFVLARASGKSQTQSALESFDCVNRNTAKVLGHELMQKPDIERAVSEIMQSEGLTKTYRVRKLKQHVDHTSPDVSLKALDQTWRLDGAYTEKHVHVNINYDDYVKEMSALDREIKQLEEELGVTG